MKNILMLSIVFMSLFSCSYIANKSSDEVAIRAIVVNPRKSEIYLSKDLFRLNIDTLFLDDNNETIKKVKIPNEGLYFLHLFPEYQMIYLKPDDSLSFHINIDEFDESMSFSGGLGFENNLLIDLFLRNEKQNEYFFYRMNKIDLKQFNHKLDSFSIIRKKLLAEYSDELKQTTPVYKKIVDLYSRSVDCNIKENFFRRHAELSYPPEYFSYRKIIKETLVDVNIPDLYSFMDAYIYNVTPNTSRNTKMMYQQAYRICADSVTNKKFRSSLFTRYCYMYIRNRRIMKADSLVQKYFSKIDKNDKAFCEKAINKNASLKVNNAFPLCKLKDKDDKLYSSDQLFKATKSIVCVWDNDWHKNFTTNIKKLAAVKKTFPDINIIFINKNVSDQKQWKSDIPTNLNMQFYQFTSNADAELIMPYSFTQVYFVNNNIIKKSMINLFSSNFRNEIIIFDEE